MFEFLTKIPEHLRGYLYLGLAILGVVVLVALLVLDLIGGADPGEWLLWIAGVAGVGGLGTAAANTARRD